MQIIISPAKEMNLVHPLAQDWQLSAESQEIVTHLKNLSPSELKKTFKINDSLLTENLAYIQAFDQTITYKAIDMYHGLAYRWMDLDALDQTALTYLDDHLTILSALYGPVPANQAIKPYRLDFTTSLKLGKKSLKAYWKPVYNKTFTKGETILNLASDEFSSLFKQTDYQWIDFEFQELKEGKVKKHSTISKKGRGRMVKFLAQHQIVDLAKIKDFNEDGYYYKADLSKPDLFVFERLADN